jgi:hypothetical protein
MVVVVKYFCRASPKPEQRWRERERERGKDG